MNRSAVSACRYPDRVTESSPPQTAPGSALDADLAFALRLADAADAVTMSRFQSADLDLRVKADATFVTDADVAAERALRELISSERPADAVTGEELGASGAAARRWILDPIDGTHNYLRGIPMWATLIALEVDDAVRVGVVSQPAIGRRWWAVGGGGAWTNAGAGPRRIRVSDVDALAHASVSFQSIAQWDEADRVQDLLRVTRAVWRDRGYGDAWPYMMLAEGRLEMVAEFGVKEHDIAAHAAIIAEAGGRLTAADGRRSLATGSVLATNGTLHDAFLRLLEPAAGPGGVP